MRISKTRCTKCGGYISWDDYPIVDIRTIEALQLLGYIDKDVKVSAIRDTIKGYHIYRSIILEISKKVKINRNFC